MRLYVPLMSIVTKKGDRGRTRLFSGEEVSKNSSRTNAYGILDELVSFIGFAKSLSRHDDIKENLESIQKTLFRLGTELATTSKTAFKIEQINDKDIDAIEELIYGYEAKIKLPKEFIIPGKNTPSSSLDICRSICRSLERLIVGLADCSEWINQNGIIYINRLSDLLFLMARKEE